MKKFVQSVFGQAVGVVAVDAALASDGGAGGAGGNIGLLGAGDVFRDLHGALQRQAIGRRGAYWLPPGPDT